MVSAISSLGATPSTSSALSAMPFSANLNALMAACSAASSVSAPSAASNIAQSTSVIVSSADSGSPPEKMLKLDTQENDCVNEQADETTDDGDKCVLGQIVFFLTVFVEFQEKLLGHSDSHLKILLKVLHFTFFIYFFTRIPL